VYFCRTKKEESLELNIMMPRPFEYDIRLSTSLEKPLPPPPIPWKNQTIIRNKNRTSYELKGDIWKTDLTEVTEDTDIIPKYELEIEFKDSQNLLTKNNETLQKIFENFWDTLCIYSLAAQHMKS